MIWSSNSAEFSTTFEDMQATAARCLLLAIAVLLASCAQSSGLGTSQAAGSASIASLEPGWRVLFDQRLGNCVACHSIPDHEGRKSGIQSTFAPALDGVALRYGAAQLRQWVVDARSINPDTLMPPFGAILSPQQITDALAVLQTLR